MAYHQREFRRPLDRQLARRRAKNYPVHIFRRGPEDRTHIGPEREQAAIARIRSVGTGAWQMLLAGGFDNASADSRVSRER
jgi:hypothetical protein